ncbi:MAG: IclR family transcriptional regulator [Deltaproteobacteria bacterium]|nr:MAG: IclR family transcriptional regulator [Deltaproteobacteria bacterium]
MRQMMPKATGFKTATHGKLLVFYDVFCQKSPPAKNALTKIKRRITFSLNFFETPYRTAQQDNGGWPRRNWQLAPRGRESYSIQSVENALDVLEALSEEEGEVRISRLSQRLGMNKTSVFRLMATFESRGYVERDDGSSKYRLGLSAYEVAQKLLSRMDLLRKARPVMEKLVRETREAVYLTVSRGGDVLFFDMIDTTHQVKIVSLVGRRYPLADTAAGRIQLAFDPEADVDSNPELARIHALGHCLDTGTLGDGVTSLAVPLLARGGRVVGSLCLVAPDFRISSELVDQTLVPRLAEAGSIISSKLGYVGHLLESDRGWDRN